MCILLRSRQFREPQLFTLYSVGEYGWLIKGQITRDADNDADTLPSQQLMLAKMITGLGLGQLPWLYTGPVNSC